MNAPTSRINAPYYELMKKPITCPECGWHGTGKDLSTSEIFECGIIELVCPKCSFDVAFTSGPTLWEAQANWEEVSPADRELVELATDQGPYQPIM